MFFGKKSDYIKLDEVISILEEQRARHHYASRASLDKQCAVEDVIKAVKYHHIKNNPKRYLVWKKVFTDEAQIFLKFREFKEDASDD